MIHKVLDINLFHERNVIFAGCRFVMKFPSSCQGLTWWWDTVSSINMHRQAFFFCFVCFLRQASKHSPFPLRTPTSLIIWILNEHCRSQLKRINLLSTLCFVLYVVLRILISSIRFDLTIFFVGRLLGVLALLWFCILHLPRKWSKEYL